MSEALASTMPLAVLRAVLGDVVTLIAIDRCVVGARDRDGEGRSVGRPELIDHRVIEAVADGLALGKGLHQPRHALVPLFSV
jgi:hypothetical protein